MNLSLNGSILNASMNTDVTYLPLPFIHIVNKNKRLTVQGVPRLLGGRPEIVLEGSDTQRICEHGADTDLPLIGTGIITTNTRLSKQKK